MPPLLHVRQLPPPADLAQPPADAIRTPQNADAGHTLFSKILVAGTGGGRPEATSVVTVHYTARDANGTTVDDSRAREQPAVWPLPDLMKGLADGIRLMVAGERRRLWIPQPLAHEWATGPLLYDVELLAIAPATGPPRAQVGNPPPDAERTSSGLAFTVLRRGTGTERPKPESTVTLHYTAWTSNGGGIFDDSVGRNLPLTTTVVGLMPGLTEAIQRMTVGEKTRYWIPPNLAFTKPMPTAAFVFDVELLAIQHNVEGRPGTLRVRCNSPDAVHTVILPDGTTRRAQGTQTLESLPPGQYRVEPASLQLFYVGILASPDTMQLAAGGTLDITINYFPIVR